MIDKQLTPRALQSIKTRKKIYDVSIELIRKQGFDSVTVQNIIRKAGVSVGAFYHYFDSKSDILHEIFAEIDRYFEQEVAGQLHGTTIEKIVDYFGYYAGFVMNQRVDFIQQLFTAKNKMFIEKGRFLRVCLKNVILEGQQNKEITSSVNAEEIENFIFIVAHGVVFDWCLHDGSYDLKLTLLHTIEKILTLFVDSSCERSVSKKSGS